MCIRNLASSSLVLYEERASHVSEAYECSISAGAYMVKRFLTVGKTVDMAQPSGSIACLHCAMSKENILCLFHIRLLLKQHKSISIIVIGKYTCVVAYIPSLRAASSLISRSEWRIQSISRQGNGRLVVFH